jgi:chromosome segregation ATPase
MLQDDIMQDNFMQGGGGFMERLSQATRSLGFPVLVHTDENNLAVSVNRGAVSQTTLPANLLPYINNKQEYCGYFSHGESLVVLYFLRFYIDGVNYTVMVQDNKKCVRLNKFFAALMQALNEPVPVPETKPTSDNYQNAEQEGIISFMDMRIKELEKTVRDRGEALATQTKELVSLNAELDSLRDKLVQQEQDAVLDKTILEQDKADLEAKLRTLQQSMGERAQEAEEQEADQELADFLNAGSQDSEQAIKNEISSIHTALSKAEKERDKLQAGLEYATRNNAALQEELDARNADIKIHKDISDSKDEEIRSLKLDLRSAQAQQSVANIEDTEAAAELVAAKEQAAKLEIENEALHQRIKSILDESLSKEEAEEQLNKIAKLKGNIKEMEKKLEKDEIIIEGFKNKFVDLKATSMPKAEHEQLLASLQASHELLQADFDSLTTRYEEQARTFVPREDYNNAIEEVEKWKKLRATMQKEQDVLQAELNTVNSEVAKLRDVNMSMDKALEQRSTEVANKEKLVSEIRQNMKEQTKTINEFRKQVDSLSEMNIVLRKNRDKLNDMLNGLSQPILTVGEGFKVASSNTALVAFTNTRSSIDMVGAACHKCVYGNEARCEWCQVDKVKTTGEPTRVTVVQGDPAQGRHLEVVFFPIFDEERTLLEVGECIIDKTEVVDLTNTLNDFKSKMNEFKKARMNDMNELAELRRLYQELTTEHETIRERNAKMLKVIERLVSEDKARELLNVRSELVETRNKLVRSAETIKNYKFKVEDMDLRYSELNKRSFMQMERLLNLVKAKNQLRAEDITSILTFLTREFEGVKKHFITKARKDAKALGAAGGGSEDMSVEDEAEYKEMIEGTHVQSEEERALYEKLHKKGKK